MTTALRSLFLDAWCVFNAWRCMGYASDYIYHGPNHGRFVMILKYPGMPDFAVQIGLIPDTFSDDDCQAQWQLFLAEVHGHAQDSNVWASWDEARQHWDRWRSVHSVPLLTAMLARALAVPAIKE